MLKKCLSRLALCRRMEGDRTVPVTPRRLAWPHVFSPMLASLSLCLTLSNLSRFSLLTAHYGGVFLLQWLFLSILFGIPAIGFFLSAGQYTGLGYVHLWSLSSPLFKGIGLALLVMQASVGIYLSVPVSWMFLYLRDSFVLKWQDCFIPYRDCVFNSSSRVSVNVADYFNGLVLRRHEPMGDDWDLGNIQFQGAFNLAIVWILIMVCLSKGLEAYGKLVYFFTIVPITGLILVCGQIIRLAHSEVHLLLAHSSFFELLSDTQQWLVVAREVFFIWIMQGAAVFQLSSHNPRRRNISRDFQLLSVLVVALYLLMGFAGAACLSIIRQHGFSYIPSSFESGHAFQFLETSQEPGGIKQGPIEGRQMIDTLLVGYSRKNAIIRGDTYSGYVPLRLATEVFPAVTVLLGPDGFSPFWTMLFYLSMSLCGLAHVMGIWRSVIEGILWLSPARFLAWDTTITFFTSLAAFLITLSFTTQAGIHLFYWWDSCMGSGWWEMCLYLGVIIALLWFRRKPFSAWDIASLLTRKSPCSTQRFLRAVFSFLWILPLPAFLLVVAVGSLRTGSFRELLHWSGNTLYEGWPPWARQLGGWFQVIPLLLIPTVAIYQVLRHICDPSIPAPFSSPWKKLCRPEVDPELVEDPRTDPEMGPSSGPGGVNEVRLELSQFQHQEGHDERGDPPPKYSPPPSYSFATGAMLAEAVRISKLLFSSASPLSRLVPGRRSLHAHPHRRRSSPSPNPVKRSLSAPPQRLPFTVYSPQPSALHS
ncbi:unnamed protein product [Darwinula stevensoni]|uniref:Uncharacterized protein n=1 Tax=Darwinula stevensoni TaxID=69355 RepID=A0A7R8ZZK9_9CRUS|nr:unnamed protein product [Darwinula stevensoni]CAG0879028.1 unnamed protein product [Darwinula stevensoni]